MKRGMGVWDFESLPQSKSYHMTHGICDGFGYTNEGKEAHHVRENELF